MTKGIVHETCLSHHPLQVINGLKHELAHSQPVLKESRLGSSTHSPGGLKVSMRQAVVVAKPLGLAGWAGAEDRNSMRSKAGDPLKYTRRRQSLQQLLSCSSYRLV